GPVPVNREGAAPGTALCPAGYRREIISAWTSWRWADWPAEGPAAGAVGTVTPASTSSVHGAVRLSTSPRPGATASRAESGGRFHRSSTVLRIEVWSNGTEPSGARTTVP